MGTLPKGRYLLAKIVGPSRAGPRLLCARALAKPPVLPGFFPLDCAVVAER